MIKYPILISGLILIIAGAYFLRPIQTDRGTALICPKCFLMGASSVVGKDNKVYEVIAAGKKEGEPIKLLLSDRPDASGRDWMVRYEGDIRGRVVWSSR
jgi:hypothetical protein